MDNNTAELLSKLAEKLATTSEHLWEVLANHAHISAIYSLMWVSVIGFIYATLFYFKGAIVSSWNKGEYGLSAIAGAIVFILFWFLMYHIKNAMFGFFDPEYWALTYIIDALR